MWGYAHLLYTPNSRWLIFIIIIQYYFIPCRMCFQDSSTVTRILVGSVSAAIAILVGWCVWTTWVHQVGESPIPPFADGEENPVAVDSDRRSLGRSKRENLAIPVWETHERIRLAWESLWRGLDRGLNIPWIVRYLTTVSKACARRISRHVL